MSECVLCNVRVLLLLCMKCVSERGSESVSE